MSAETHPKQSGDTVKEMETYGYQIETKEGVQKRFCLYKTCKATSLGRILHKDVGLFSHV